MRATWLVEKDRKNTACVIEQENEKEGLLDTFDYKL